MAKIICSQCGKEKYKRPSEVKKYNFCCQECFKKFREKHPSEYTAGQFSKKHGMFGTSTYVCWAGMKQRCNDKKCEAYRNYGGRGIKYSDDWEKFENFYRDMGKRPKGASLDRIDVNGDYCKENCRWANWVVQANNKRTNRVIEYNGECKTLAEWARYLRINIRTLAARLDKYNWSVKKSFETPVRECRKCGSLYHFTWQHKKVNRK